jgi:hypothetical protein
VVHKAIINDILDSMKKQEEWLKRISIFFMDKVGGNPKHAGVLAKC